MDLVSRLKEYITKVNIPVTQFADMCGIARPTLSQLLNGRNKKVSDEIVTKIHVAFPELSVYWLMFGEGDMESSENIELSETKKTANISIDEASLFDRQVDNEVFEHSSVQQDMSQSGIIEFFDQSKDVPREKSDGLSDDFIKKDKPAETFDAGKSNSRHGEAVSIKVNQGEGKLITNIVVFYSDNSFQSFYPA